MDFYIFSPKSILNRKLTYEEQEIKSIIYKIEANEKFRFQKIWIHKLLQIFNNKDELSVFFKVFNKYKSPQKIQYSNIQDCKNYSSQEYNFGDLIENTDNFKDYQSNLQMKDTKIKEKLFYDSLQNNKINEQYWQWLKRQNKALTPNVVAMIKSQLIYMKNNDLHLDWSTLALKYNVDLKSLKRLEDKWRNNSALKQFLSRQKYANQQQKKIKNQSIFSQRDNISRKPYKQFHHANLQQYIQKNIKENPYISLYEMRDKLQKAKVKGCRSITIRYLRKLFHKLHYIKKRLPLVSSYRNSVINIQKGFNYCKALLEFVNQHYKIFFLHQCKFNLNLLSNFIWAKKDNSVVFPPIDRSNDVSLLIIISEQGEMYWKLLLAYNRQSSKKDIQLKSMLEQIVKNNSSSDRKVMLMDNITNLGQIQIKQYLNNHRWNFLILSSEFTHLNPISYLQRDIRAQLKLRNIKTIQQLQYILHQICSTILPASIQNYFQCVFKQTFNGFNRIPFDDKGKQSNT